LYGCIRDAAFARARSSRLLTIMRHAHLDLSPAPSDTIYRYRAQSSVFFFWAARMSAAIG
jgi:hypothetical protein